VSLQNDSVNDRSLLESFLSKYRVHLGHSQGDSGNVIPTSNKDSHNEGYIPENISNKKQRSSNTVVIESDYLIHLEKEEGKFVGVENVYKEKLLAIENELSLYKAKLVAVENELGLYKTKLVECKATILNKNERVHNLLSTRFEKVEILDAVINELSINSVQLAKSHGDKPLEFYSERQLNSTHKSFIDECTGPFLALMNEVCKVQSIHSHLHFNSS
jgi:hypothetical protein